MHAKDHVARDLDARAHACVMFVGPYTFNATGPASATYDCASYTSPYQHRVTITGLTPATRYYYVCGDQTNGVREPMCMLLF